MNDELAKRIDRDGSNARIAKSRAEAKLLDTARVPISIDIRTGPTQAQMQRRSYERNEKASLQAIADQAFNVMAEVVTENESADGKLIEQAQLWYGNENVTVNQVFGNEKDRLVVLAWTHPGLQIALSRDIGEYVDISARGYRLQGVEPRARALFDEVIPQISGIYDPGGAVRSQKKTQVKSGLKAVKLKMTRSQVDAFISRMSGMMIITGAPGSGKTTVAFQRIRFLIDQQQGRIHEANPLLYSTELTKVFLANQNLVVYSKQLLQKDLDIPDAVVSLVAPFIASYLESVWIYKLDARPRQKHLQPIEEKGRRACFGLANTESLQALWAVYEKQISGRLRTATSAAWCNGIFSKAENVQFLVREIVKSVKKGDDLNHDPLRSNRRLDVLYRTLGPAYERARSSLRGERRTEFDSEFTKWIYSVYDPIDSLRTYFGARQSELAIRIRRATGGLLDESQIISDILEDLDSRRYGAQEVPWLAWLLRFSMPEVVEAKAKFREIPSSLGMVIDQGNRLTHVVIDEAQDLSVVEASLLGSLVDPKGALTVSADFRQIVSPVHGMTDPSAFRIGNQLIGQQREQIYPFAKNMRQSQQIGLFLREFYLVAFGEQPNFEANESVQGTKPQLVLSSAQELPLRIKQLYNVFKRSDGVESVALLQINEDEESMLRLREKLKEFDLPMSKIWEATSKSKLVTTSVERIKGLEFDAVIVLGLEDADRSALNFTVNRSYVALSRPTRRLAILCSEFPRLLQKVDKTLYERRNV